MTLNKLYSYDTIYGYIFYTYMSFLKSSLAIQASTWLEHLIEESPHLKQFLKAYMHNQPVEPIPETAWDWMRVAVLHDMPRQTDVVHACLKAKAPADELWRALDTGRRITMFDMPSMLVGGMTNNTRGVFRVLSTAYDIIFGRKDVLPLEDLVDDLCRQEAWVTVSCLAHAHVYGPTGELKPLLHYAVLVRRLDVLRAVMRALDAWGDMDARTHIMNMRGHRDETLLHLICAQDDSTWVKILLGSGADPLAVDVDGKTPFHVSSSLEKMEVLKRALTHPTRAWFDVLHDMVIIAASRGDSTLLQAVLDAGGDPNMPGAFDAALEASSTPCVTLLAAYGGDPNNIEGKHTPPKDVLRAWMNVGGRPIDSSRRLVRKVFGSEDPNRVLFLHALYDLDVEDMQVYASRTDVSGILDAVRRIVSNSDTTTKMQELVATL